MVIWETSFNYDTISFRLLPKPQGVRSAPYADCVCAFDIETTRLKEVEQSIMYVWQFCIDWPDGTDTIIMGRTWGQFKHMLYHLGKRLDGLHLKCYIHNASYEFQFLAGIYDFKPHEVFALESRQVLNFTMYGKFDFFCSYKLFNMNLDMATHKYAPDFHKKTGTFDYSVRRFSDTPLTRKELLYCIYDVWGLCKAVRGLLRLHGDSIYTVPRTSTGFVRREVREAMRPEIEYLRQTTPPYRVYQLLRSAFRGGNTHANRYYANEILHNVTTMDISSSYPAQQCLKEFPVSQFKACENSRQFLNKMLSRGRALLMWVRLRNVKLRSKYTSIPYIPLAKCIKIGVYQNDNGRILSASMLEMCITDIDFKIIDQQYTFSLDILEMYKSMYGPLPKPLKDINKKYFVEKTALKGVVGQELYYLKAKNLLNSIYLSSFGMSVQSQTPERIQFENGQFVVDGSKTEAAVYEAAVKNPYTLYQFGVWTTCHARQALQSGIDLCGDNLVYVDTDSCKFLGDVDFSGYNEDVRSLSSEKGVFADDAKGKRHYMGLYEFDGRAARFKTLGAKKYAYEDEKGKLHITVSGVPKKAGAAELTRKGGLDAFNTGFVFTESGKLESVYNDDSMTAVIDGRKLKITRNVVLRETTYALDITEDYGTLLDLTSNSLNKIMKFWRNCQL